MVPSNGFTPFLASLEHGSSAILHIIQLLDGRVVSGSFDALKVWNIETGECITMLSPAPPRATEMKIFQLNEGTIAPGLSVLLTRCPTDSHLTLWNMATIAEQRWGRRRLFLLIAKHCRTSSTPLLVQLLLSPSFRKIANLQSGDSSQARYVLVENIASML